MRVKPQKRQSAFFGRPVAVRGHVLAEPDARSAWRALLDCDGCRISADVSALPELAEMLPVGATVGVCGCGLVETENWRTGDPFPQTKDLVVIVRTPDDITVLADPPFWTPGKLLIVISTLIGLVAALAVWNRVLNRLVERRGRQLLREGIARTDAESRTRERTRLAAEMHDSLSQSLTGIACQIDAIELAREKRPERLGQHLDLARLMLANCRTQLRNCLWDLRSDTLNERDAATAIRKTVQHHAANASLAIDFPPPRQAFSDTVFHEILCILRELVSNAVRHGNATHIDITGKLEGPTLTLTVRDDGNGFDPERRVGIGEGHFGLAGVSERLERLNGKLTICSAPGKGATITAAIAIET